MKHRDSERQALALRQASRIALVLIVAAIYIATMARDVMTDDTAEFQVRCAWIEPTHPPGYPLLLLVGKVIAQLPLATVAWRLSLASVIFGIATVATLYELLLLLLRSSLAAFATALVFALSHTFWMQSLVAEAYSLNAFFHTSLLYLLARYERFPGERPQVAVGVLFLTGLAAGNHVVIVLMLPVYLLWFWWQSKRRMPRRGRLVGGALALALGLSIYLVLTVRMHSLASSVDLALGGPSRGLLFAFTPVQVARRLAVGLGYHAYQFPFVAGVVGIGGWLWALRRRRAWWALTSAIWLITVGYAVNFDSSDVYVFYIPAYIAFAIWVGFGFDALYRALGSRPLSWASAVMLCAVAIAPLTYWTTYRTIERAGVAKLSRDKGVRYYLFPPKNKAAWFGCRVRHLMKTATWRGALLVDWNYYFTARYLRDIEHLRSDLAVRDVTPAGPGDRRPALEAQALADRGIGHFYFTDGLVANEASGSRPVHLHTIGWYVGDDIRALARQARRRLSHAKLRATLPNIWQWMAGRLESGRTLEAWESLRDRLPSPERISDLGRRVPPVKLAGESRRLLRGQAMWIAVENLSALFPFDPWTTGGSVGDEAAIEPINVGLGLTFIRRSDIRRFRPRRPLHNMAGRFDPSSTWFVVKASRSDPVAIDDRIGKSFFSDETFYQYVIAPCDAVAGDYEVFINLDFDYRSKDAARTILPWRGGRHTGIYIKVE